MSQFEDRFGNPIDPADLGDYEPDDGEDDEGDALDEFGFDEGDLYDVPDAPIDDQAAPAPSRSQGAGAVDAVVQDPDEPVLMEKAEPAPATAGLSKRGMLALAGVGVAVLAVAGVAAFGMSQIGNQNTAADIKAAGQSKVEQVKEKKDKVVAEHRVIDTCRVGMMDGGRSLGDAMSSGSTPPPVRLVVDASAPLPAPFVQSRVNADGVSGVPSLLQLTPTSWGVYTTRPLTKAEKKSEEVDRPFWWKADAVLDPVGGTASITGDSLWSGGDLAAPGACEPGKPGTYAATGAVPADAAGLVDGVASVDAIVGIAGEPTRAVAIMGDNVTLVTLAEVPAEDGTDEAGTASE